MRRERFVVEVLSDVEFTAEEVRLLRHCSASHYDLKCRSLSECGGFLYGMENRLRALETSHTSWRLSTRDLDTLCKVAESPVYHDHVLPAASIWQKLSELLTEAKEKFRELNPDYFKELER